MRKLIISVIIAGMVAVPLMNTTGCTRQAAEPGTAASPATGTEAPANQGPAEPAAPGTAPGETPGDAPRKAAEIAIACAPGPASYPVAYMADKGAAEDYVEKLSVRPWRTYDQLLAMVTSKQVHLAISPVTNGMMLYNKGMGVRLVNVAVWGMLYVVSPDRGITSIKDLKGKEISVTGRGGIHDLVFRHLVTRNGLNPETDMKIVYLDLPEASAKLATGEIKYAVLNEPNSSIAIMNAAKGGVTLQRVLDLQKEWGAMVGDAEGRIPQAGLFVVDGAGIAPEVVRSFAGTYLDAARWVNDHAAEAGPVVEKYFDTMKAQAIPESLKFARLQPVRAGDCRAEVERFFNELLKTAPPESIGGKLPDAGFYFEVEN